jgi:hypothetical protein
MVTYNDPENGFYIYFMYYMYYMIVYINPIIWFLPGWLKSIVPQILHDLDHRKPVLCVIPVDIREKLPLVPVGDTGTIPHHLRNLFPGAPSDLRPGAGVGYRMWFINSWAMVWSRDM